MWGTQANTRLKKCGKALPTGERSYRNSSKLHRLPKATQWIDQVLSILKLSADVYFASLSFRFLVDLVAKLAMINNLQSVRPQIMMLISTYKWSSAIRDWCLFDLHHLAEVLRVLHQSAYSVAFLGSMSTCHEETRHMLRWTTGGQQFTRPPLTLACPRDTGISYQDVECANDYDTGSAWNCYYPRSRLRDILLSTTRAMAIVLLHLYSRLLDKKDI